MEPLEDYVFALVTAALVCGILTSLIPQGTAGRLIKLVCGLFLTFTVLSPAAELDIHAILNWDFYDEQQVAGYIRDGEEMVRDAKAEIIKRETQAYILDKAESLGATVTAEVVLSEDAAEPVPVEVILTGSISPWARARLEDQLIADLGIQREALKWTG